MSQAKTSLKQDLFTPYNPESPCLQTGDEGNFKSKDEEKPGPLGQGYTGFTSVRTSPTQTTLCVSSVSVDQQDILGG